jgi:hypothetical protein
MRSRSEFTEGLLFSFFVVFSFVVCIGSFLIQLSFIRFSVVVIIGHDDIEMWTRKKLINACDTAIGLEFEEAFLAKVDRKGKSSHWNQVEETAVTSK